MFDNLVESRAKRQRTWRQAALSVMIHGLVIFVAVKATQGVAATVREREIDTTMVFIRPPEPTQPTPPQQPEPPQPDMIVTLNPPPKGFQTVVAPTDIPKEIPPVDLNEKPFDPRNFTGRGVEGGSALGVVGGTGPVEPMKGAAAVYTAENLEDPVQPISIPQPRYPPALQSAGIPGRVELQYIVDTTGHAEPNSFKVVSQTHHAFVAPAQEAILKGVFKPAKFHGRPVRQLVQQPVVFHVGP